MKIGKLKEFIELIETGNTGSPKVIAEKFGVSDRLIYYYVSVLKKEFKAPIEYCRHRKTYYFTENGEIDLNWKEIID